MSIAINLFVPGCAAKFAKMVAYLKMNTANVSAHTTLIIALVMAQIAYESVGSNASYVFVYVRDCKLARVCLQNMKTKEMFIIYPAVFSVLFSQHC